MASVPYQNVPVGFLAGTLISWDLSGKGTSDTPVAVEMSALKNRTVQMVGIFNSATVKMQGSNDATKQDGSDGTWVVLQDDASTPADIAMTAAGLARVRLTTRWIRPMVTTGSPTSTKVFLNLA